MLAAETLGRTDAETAAVIGAGVNGRACARTFLGRGRSVSLWDVDPERTRRAADELGATAAASLEEALAADLLVTVTPGHALLLPDGSLAPGQHVSLMGADGPGKAEIAATELARTHVFCDDWEQASHGGELAHAAEAGLVREADVGRLGAVLAGAGDGRRSRGRDHDLRLHRARDPGPRDRPRGRERARPSSTCACSSSKQRAPGRRTRARPAHAPSSACATRSPHAKPSTFPCPE